ncbi:MAG: hypothetical protein DRP65_08220 [Planctomycetota bacterium]|nr:MAG: hypothetical protein DRP65_08220 [Planctomycetota bacterium]
MINLAQNSRECQEERLKIKTLSQQMQNIAIHGTGLSPWEAGVLVETIEQVYFADPALRQASEGQLRYSCVAINEPAGKPIKECRMVTVLLTLFDPKDRGQLGYRGKQASIALRQKEIVVATRGQVRDIGPGVTHRGIAVRLWLEGKEPVEIARHINHSIAAVENYLEKFKRVAYLRRKSFDDYQSALTIGISVAAVKTFVELYKQYQHKPFFKQRIDEIELVGSQYYMAQDEKKGSISSNGPTARDCVT